MIVDTTVITTGETVSLSSLECYRDESVHCLLRARVCSGYDRRDDYRRDDRYAAH